VSQPPPPPPPLPPPPGGGVPAPGSASSTNGFAIASLVTAILCCPILGIIFGFVAKNQIKQSGGTQGGDGLATAGIIIGFVLMGIYILLNIFGAISYNFSTK
jgi:hypothetical protein